MTGFLSNLLSLYRQEMERHRNRPFLRAVMGACATVAMADGSVDFRERMRLDQVIVTLEALKIYDPHEGVNLFNDFVEAIKANPKEGREQALEAMRAEAGEASEKATLLIRICLAVSEVEGKIPLTEQIEIVGLCSQLGVQPDNVGLYTDSTANDISVSD